MANYRANGKLLLAGEYFVLEGAEALVLPVRLGQYLEVNRISNEEDSIIMWKAFHRKSEWFKAKISIPGFEVIATSEQNIAESLIYIFRAILMIKPDIFEKMESIEFTSHLEFDPSWGMGSSSTLISNLAAWAEVDPMELFLSVSHGSGYDVAASGMDSPFTFKRRGDTFQTTNVSLSTEITPYLYFVYSGQKQNSKTAIANFRNYKQAEQTQIDRISEISKSMASTKDLDLFEKLVSEHETILSTHMNISPVRELLFPDYSGIVKSLGAWGGDFLLFIHRGSRDELESYLTRKGLSIVFSYNELICS